MAIEGRRPIVPVIQAPCDPWEGHPLFPTVNRAYYVNEGDTGEIAGRTDLSGSGRYVGSHRWSGSGDTVLRRRIADRLDRPEQQSGRIARVLGRARRTPAPVSVFGEGNGLR